MANRVTVWWQGEEYDAVRRNSSGLAADPGTVWEVLHAGAPLTTFAAEPDEVLAQATDDAWLVERTGGTVRVVESTPANFKVTTPHDLRIAELLLADRLPPASAH